MNKKKYIRTKGGVNNQPQDLTIGQLNHVNPDYINIIEHLFQDANQEQVEDILGNNEIITKIQFLQDNYNPNYNINQNFTIIKDQIAIHFDGDEMSDDDGEMIDNEMSDYDNDTVLDVYADADNDTVLDVYADDDTIS